MNICLSDFNKNDPHVVAALTVQNTWKV